MKNYVVNQFNNKVDSWVTIFKDLNPNLHFIHCIRSNHYNAPRELNQWLLANQVRYLSLWDYIYSSTSIVGYQVRMEYKQFYREFIGLDQNDNAA